MPLQSPPKRVSFTNRIGIAIMVAGLCALAWALWIEPQRLVVTENELRLPNWPNRLVGMKVALLSDLHVGSPFWDIPALTRLVERTNEQKPDLVLLAGDYQINDVPGGAFVAAEPIADQLGMLKAPLGVFAVLGNHDWWNEGERLRAAFTARGITVLEEDSRRLSFRGQSFYVVGLADQITRRSNPRAVLAKLPASAPSLLLVHEPDVFATFPELGVAPSLTLAGHTHGGQVWLPVLGRRVVPSEYGERYAYGEVVEEGRHLFVTSGVGTSVFPIRFRVPPEIAMLTLR